MFVLQAAIEHYAEKLDNVQKKYYVDKMNELNIEIKKVLEYQQR